MRDDAVECQWRDKIADDLNKYMSLIQADTTWLEGVVFGVDIASHIARMGAANDR